MADLVPLEKIVKKVMVRTRLATIKELKEDFMPLSEELNQNLGLDGFLGAILVYDGHGKVNCYYQNSYHLDGGTIFRRLNQTIGVKGTKVTGITSFPEVHRLTAKMKGYFVSSLNFLAYEEEQNFDDDFDDDKENIKEKFTDTYLALINIPVNPDENVYSFNLE